MPIHRSIPLVASQVALHIRNVVKFGHIPVFLQIRSFVGGHSLDEIFDNLIRYKGVSEIEFSDVWLHAC